MESLGADDLFDLPEFSGQDELLRLEPVSRTLDSHVTDPVARVVLDMPQPHMDRTFDYEVPASMADAPVGARVVVEVGARKVHGFIVERDTQTKIGSKLRPIRRVVSKIPVLDPEVLTLAKKVAERQASPLADCLRLAIPQRHARAEKAFVELDPPQRTEWNVPEIPAIWSEYAGGEALIEHVSRGESINAVIYMLAKHRFSQLLLAPLQATLHCGNSALIVVPTPAVARDLAQFLKDHFPAERVATMVSEDDHATRYTEFLAVLTGRARIVVGTRSAGWAPAQSLGMVVLVDDHHSALAEPRSPYIHARQLLRLRAETSSASFLAFNYGPSVELAAWSDWAKPIEAVRTAVANNVPQVMAASNFAYEGGEWSRMPSSVFSVVRAGLERGSVLVSVPKSGYIPLVACARCREIPRCSECDGTLTIPHPDAAPQCVRCARTVHDFHCPNCRGQKLRPIRIGSHRTAQEVGRAFQKVPIHIAGVGKDRGVLSSESRIVVATPGTEPTIEGGYAAGIVLDAGYLLRSSRLDAEVYFLRTLSHLAAQIQPRKQGGQLLVVGDVPDDLIAPVHTWSMGEWGRTSVDERRSIGLPPGNVWVEVAGPWEEVRSFLGLLRGMSVEAGVDVAGVPLDALLAGGVHDLVPGMAVLGPQLGSRDDHVVHLRFPEELRNERTAMIYAAKREASIRRLGHVRVRVDPQL